MAGWLLHINILAGLARPNSGQRMPMVWEGQGDGIHVLGIEQRSHIGVLLGVITLQLAYQRHRALPGALVYVTKSGDAGIGIERSVGFHVVGTAAS